MKLILISFVAALMTVHVFAANLELKDGRVLKEAAIVSQSPRTVVIKHAGGLCSVSKALLPSELQSQYPLNEAAAQEADRQAVTAREAAHQLERAEAERVARARAQRQEMVAANEAHSNKQANQENAQYAAVERDAKERAEDYFRHEYNPGNSSAYTCDCSVTLSEVRPVEGWAGRWLVKGRAYLKYYQSQGRSFTSQTRGFEAYYTREGRKTNFEVTLR